jgi:hypothetical protein
MTAISTLLTDSVIASASDSFLTEIGTGRMIETRQPKLVCIKPLRMVVSYWGLARTSSGFDTFEFLKSFATRNKGASSPEHFASSLASEVTNKINSFRLVSPSNGLGFQIAAFEKVSGIYIPELFLCTNYLNTYYSSTSPKFSVTRESFKDPKHSDPSAPTARMEFYSLLKNHLVFRFNNGDPEMFNPVADAIMQMSMALQRRGHFSTAKKTEAYRQWVREPIQAIANLQKRICKKSNRVVGGIVHDVIIDQSGNIQPSSNRIPILH